MELLLSLMSLARAALFLLLTVIGASANSFCSLTIHVTNPDGYKPTGVPAGVVERNGRSESGVTRDGEVRFCDLGMNPVMVRIGEQNQCNEVIVRNVPVLWNT